MASCFLQSWVFVSGNRIDCGIRKNPRQFEQPRRIALQVFSRHCEPLPIVEKEHQLTPRVGREAVQDVEDLAEVAIVRRHSRGNERSRDRQEICPDVQARTQQLNAGSPRSDASRLPATRASGHVITRAMTQ